jgi:hypothetical protein
MKLEKEEKWVDAFKKGEPQSIEKVITVYGNTIAALGIFAVWE